MQHQAKCGLRALRTLLASDLRSNATLHLQSFSSKAASATADGQGRSGAASLVLYIPSMLCGALAYWQYQRMKWKEGLVSLRKDMLEKPAEDILTAEISDYKKVAATGVLKHEYSLYVGPRPRSVPGQGVTPGYFVVTPLYDPERKCAVLVNRGWVPNTWEGDAPSEPSATTTPAASEPAQPSAPAKRSWWGWLWGSSKGQGQQQASSSPSSGSPEAQAPPQRLTTVVGVIQPSETPSSAIPDNKPEQLEFHWFDVPTLATTCGLPRDTPLIQVISDDPGTLQQKQRSPVDEARSPRVYRPLTYPVPKNAEDLLKFSTNPRDHLSYALTWATLFVALGLMARKAITNPPKTIRMVDNRATWGGHTAERQAPKTVQPPQQQAQPQQTPQQPQ